MMLDQANDELCRHRNAALTNYGRRLLEAGADFDGEQFRADMIEYATTLERWRLDSIDIIRQVIEAMAEKPFATLN
jgi:hypothetical protein